MVHRGLYLLQRLRPLRAAAVVAAAVLAATGTACVSRHGGSGLDRPAPPSGRILVLGHLSPAAARVVLPGDPDGFDASLERCAFAPDGRILPRAPVAGCNEPRRYGARGTADLAPDIAARVASHGWDDDALRERIDQVVLHYDAAVTSRRCFEVLHDERGLSCHFLVDVDGTIRQTLDLVHRARHATVSNDRSIGVEIAHVGAFPVESAFDRLYSRDERGLLLTIPATLRPPPLLGGQPFRPARPAFVRGRIHGRALVQPDFTAAQYESVRRLVATLRSAFPRIEGDAPRESNSGEVRTTALPPGELAAFHGVLGHFHVTESKIDPGPAFNWGAVLPAAR